MGRGTALHSALVSADTTNHNIIKTQDFNKHLRNYDSLVRSFRFILFILLLLLLLLTPDIVSTIHKINTKMGRNAEEFANFTTFWRVEYRSMYQKRRAKRR